MPHITAQWFSTDSTNSFHGHAVQRNGSLELGGYENFISPGVQLGLGGLPTKNLLTMPDSSAVSSRSPQTQRLKILLTPTSTAPTIFDSPLKSSPSSSISTANSLALVQRVTTPIAELEDTSVVNTSQELEDTSKYALCSQSRTNTSAYAFKSEHPTVSIFSFCSTVRSLFKTG